MRTILLADDEVNLRVLVRATLEDPDFRILEAPCGKEAVEMARRESPDLLLLDWMMPSMTGIQVIKELRDDPSTRTIPVIMLTAKGQEADREEALALGVHHYLVKPFSPLELLETVETVLQEGRGGE